MKHKKMPEHIIPKRKNYEQRWPAKGRKETRYFIVTRLSDGLFWGIPYDPYRFQAKNGKVDGFASLLEASEKTYPMPVARQEYFIIQCREDGRDCIVYQWWEAAGKWAKRIWWLEDGKPWPKDSFHPRSTIAG